MNKVLLIATYDSFLKAGVEGAKQIDNAKIEIKIRISTKNQLSQKQISDVLNGEEIPYSFFYLNNYKDIDFTQYDIIIISAGNAFHHSFFEYFISYQSSIQKRIVTISLFPGVIFGEINSIVARINADILLCNNRMDYEIANNVKKHYNLNTQLLLHGLPTIKKIMPIERKYIYFFEQVKIPETYIDRMYLITRLVELAKKYPSEIIYIKSRVSLNEKTIHPNKYPLETLLEEYGKEHQVPTNLMFTYEDVSVCLAHAKSVITISSTVAFEAIYNNIPTYIVSDFGLRKEFANYDFLLSGCMCTFSEINEVAVNVNQNWANEMLSFPINRKEMLNKLIKQQLEENNVKDNFTLNTREYSYINFIKLRSRSSKRIMQFIKKVLNRKLQKFFGC